MSNQAHIALFAAQVVYPRCGRYAAARFAAKAGVSSLYRIARQLEAVAS